MRKKRQYLLDADVDRQRLENILGLTGRFNTPAFVSKSKDVPDAYHQQIVRLKEQGPQSQQRELDNDPYVWLREEDLKIHVGNENRRAYFRSLETLQAELEKTRKSPLLVHRELDGETYILAYAC
jgi:hypothetical protein